MDIKFPSIAAYDFGSTSVTAPVVVDGKHFRVLVSVEALQDHFGLTSFTSQDAIAAYNASRDAIEAVATRFYSGGGSGDVILTTKSF